MFPRRQPELQIHRESSACHIKRAKVVVVGAGPAGTSAAILCAQAGLDVVILEREQFPRDRPGETLHPGIEPLIEKLGAADEFRSAGFLRHEGNWVEWDLARRFEPFGSDESGPWRGFQAWRADFDAILLARAVRAGAEVCQPLPVSRPIRHEGRVAGVLTSQGSIEAPFVIDAAGQQHWLARQMDLRIQHYSPRLLARYGYVDGDCPPCDSAPAIVANQTGWTWLARVRRNLYHWTRHSLPNEALPSDRSPREFNGLKPRGRTLSADVTWRMVSNIAGPGFFLAGDAAAVLDPVSSHGVLKAIMSGMMIGYLIIRIVKEGNDEETANRAYQQWFRRWFVQDLAKLRGFYGSMSLGKS